MLGLTEGYHGDTLGAMDAVSPSPFNGRLQTPWYRGRGLFLEPPTAALQQGEWRVALPPDMAAAAGADANAAAGTRFGSQAELFAVAARMGGDGGGAGRSASLYSLYRRHIQSQLDAYDAAAAAETAAAGTNSNSGSGSPPARALGACMLEPVLQGAGGMRLIDPLYQRALVDECRCVGGCGWPPACARRTGLCGHARGAACCRCPAPCRTPGLTEPSPAALRTRQTNHTPGRAACL